MYVQHTHIHVYVYIYTMCIHENRFMKNSLLRGIRMRVRKRVWKVMLVIVLMTVMVARLKTRLPVVMTVFLDFRFHCESYRMYMYTQQHLQPATCVCFI